jgi:hypothetical protein
MLGWETEHEAQETVQRRWITETVAQMLGWKGGNVPHQRRFLGTNCKPWCFAQGSPRGTGGGGKAGSRMTQDRQRRSRARCEEARKVGDGVTGGRRIVVMLQPIRACDPVKF